MESPFLVAERGCTLPGFRRWEVQCSNKNDREIKSDSAPVSSKQSIGYNVAVHSREDGYKTGQLRCNLQYFFLDFNYSFYVLYGSYYVSQ